MPRTTVWLRNELHAFAKDNHINVSRVVRETLVKIAKEEYGYTETELSLNVKGNRDKNLILRVRCPNCGNERNTTSVRIVECFSCNKRYAVFPKESPSRIVSIVRGTQDDLDRTYRMYFKNGR
jgi:ribosomal protein S27E